MHTGVELLVIHGEIAIRILGYEVNRAVFIH